MATTKLETVLDNNVTLVASAADHESTVWDLHDGYGGIISIKITNGVTGPTIAAQCQVYQSPDNSNWYKYGGAWSSSLGNNIVSSITIPIDKSVKYIKVLSGSNTGQNVVLRISGTELTKVL